MARRFEITDVDRQSDLGRTTSLLDHIETSVQTEGCGSGNVSCPPSQVLDRRPSTPLLKLICQGSPELENPVCWSDSIPLKRSNSRFYPARRLAHEQHRHSPDHRMPGLPSRRRISPLRCTVERFFCDSERLRPGAGSSGAAVLSGSTKPAAPYVAEPRLLVGDPEASSLGGSMSWPGPRLYSAWLRSRNDASSP